MFMNNRLLSYTPLISLHKYIYIYISVYENNRLLRKPPLLGPPLSLPELWTLYFMVAEPERGIASKDLSDFEATFESLDATFPSCDPSLRAFATANLRTKILNFKGFDSSRILILRVEFSCPWGIAWKV